jgi:hypothetical protein
MGSYYKNSPMSHSSKVILRIVVIGIVVAGVWWYMSGVNESAQVSMEQQTNSQSAAASTASNSDAALAQDASNIDTQLNGLNSDSAQVDNGLNSQ